MRTASGSTPAPDPSGQRQLAGVLAGLLVAAILAVPVFWTGLFVYAAFTGCFIECGTPDYGVGLLWAAITALLLATPFGIGMAVAGVRSRAAWLTLLALVVLVVGGWSLAAVAA